MATGSFDASVGVWKRWDQDMNPKPESEIVEFMNGVGEVDGGLRTNGGENDNADEDEDWRFALVLDGHDSEVKSVSWSAGGNFLATCSRDKSVWIWEEIGEDDFETIAVLQEHQGDVKYVAWHPEEELLASASYDDDIRLWREDIDDWGCVGVLKGHDSTVWAVEWEAIHLPMLGKEIEGGEKTAVQEKWLNRRDLSGPRLLSCSDDMTIRIWRRQPRERAPQQSKLSIIKSGSNEEDWVEEARLPRRHKRAVYSVAWSQKTGRIVSTGGDGKIVVYEERWKSKNSSLTSENGHRASEDIDARIKTTEDVEVKEVEEIAEWFVLAELEGAHGVFEINHVCWARRADRSKRSDDEEIIISTGDDGVAKVWILDVP